MARSDQTPVVTVRWDSAERRWVGDGIRAATLTRTRFDPSIRIEPVGRLVDDMVKARAKVRAAERAYTAAQRDWKQHVMEAATKHHVPQVDVAHLAGISRQRVNEIISEIEDEESAA